MSRLERHKLRREGQISGVDLSENKTLVDETNFEDSFDINPIIENEKRVEAKRKRSIDEPTIVQPTVCVDDLKQQAQRNKTELFDIDDAFQKLHTQRKDPENDTQLDIMTGIFSQNEVEFNDTEEIKRGNVEQKVQISEEELMKLLEKKEKSHIKKVAKKRKLDKKKVVEEIESTEPYLKDELEIEEIFEVDNSDSIKTRMKIKQESNNLDDKLSKKSIPLVALLVVLLLVLVFLVFKFLSKR